MNKETIFIPKYTLLTNILSFNGHIIATINFIFFLLIYLIFKLPIELFFIVIFFSVILLINYILGLFFKYKRIEFNDKITIVNRLNKSKIYSYTNIKLISNFGIIFKKPFKHLSFRDMINADILFEKMINLEKENIIKLKEDISETIFQEGLAFKAMSIGISITFFLLTFIEIFEFIGILNLNLKDIYYGLIYLFTFISTYLISYLILKIKYS